MVAASDACVKLVVRHADFSDLLALTLAQLKVAIMKGSHIIIRWYKNLPKSSDKKMDHSSAPNSSVSASRNLLHIRRKCALPNITRSAPVP